MGVLLAILVMIVAIYYTVVAVKEMRHAGCERVGLITLMTNVIIGAIMWLLAFFCSYPDFGLIVAVYAFAILLAARLILSVSPNWMYAKEWAKILFLVGSLPFAYSSISIIMDNVGFAGIMQHPWLTTFSVVMVAAPGLLLALRAAIWYVPETESPKEVR